MVDWTSSQEIARENVAYVNVIFACFGLYVWEVFQTSDFELSILTRRRKLRWQWVIFFFLCRYCLIFSIAGLMATFTLKTSINCQALYTFVCWAGNMSIICSSTTLMFRTIAMWERKLPIMIVLGVLCLAHWALLWRGMFIITARYDPTSMACVVTTTKRLFLGLTYWSTMGFNLIILIVHVVGLLRRDRGSSIRELLFKDGVLYYLIAFSCNALPAILNVINLNPIMNLIATVPAAVLSAMAACRTVTHLPDIDDDDDVYVHSATQLAAAPGSGGTTRLPPSAARRFQSRYPTRPEVHVTTDHIVMQDFAVPMSGSSPSSVKDTPLVDDTKSLDSNHNAV